MNAAIFAANEMDFSVNRGVHRICVAVWGGGLFCIAVAVQCGVFITFHRKRGVQECYCELAISAAMWLSLRHLSRVISSFWL